MTVFIVIGIIAVVIVAGIFLSRKSRASPVPPASGSSGTQSFTKKD